MIGRLARALFVAGACIAVAAGSAGGMRPNQVPAPIFTQSGSGTAQTSTFRVPSNWDLSWHYDCSNFGTTGNFLVQIFDYYGNNSTLDLDNQGVNQLGQSGTSVEHYHSGRNTKFLKIDSECAWTVSVTTA
jgi:hypothetical protein